MTPWAPPTERDEDLHDAEGGAPAPALRAGGVVMLEDLFVIRMNIAHYRAMLALAMEGEKRSVVERLLAEAERSLVLATDGAKPS